MFYAYIKDPKVISQNFLQSYDNFKYVVSSNPYKTHSIPLSHFQIEHDVGSHSYHNPHPLAQPSSRERKQVTYNQKQKGDQRNNNIMNFLP